MRSTFSSQKGASAVEFALVLPLLMLILFGIIEFSLLMYNKAMITNASRELVVGSYIALMSRPIPLAMRPLRILRSGLK